jgi:hypothetical protein
MAARKVARRWRRSVSVIGAGRAVADMMFPLGMKFRSARASITIV